VLVTGRSAGWVDALIKLMPFDAVVGENGALIYYWPQRQKGRQPGLEAEKLYWTASGYQCTAPGPELRAQHEKAREQILKKYPRARVASDQPYRMYDLAIDFAEEVRPALSLQDAAGIEKIFAELGATAKVSSIHVNGWWGNFSKADALFELLKKFNLSLKTNTIYVGDSPNDGPLFAAAGMSVGVANIKEFVSGATKFQLPQYVTDLPAADGALEIFKALPRVDSV